MWDEAGNGLFPDDAVMMVAGPEVMMLADPLTKTDRRLSKAQVPTEVQTALSICGVCC